MEFDYSKLLGRIKECGYTQASLAEAMDRNKGTFSTKINGQSFFTTAEIATICKLLNISYKDIPSYFFTVKVQKN